MKKRDKSGTVRRKFGPKKRDCPSKIGTVGKYESFIVLLQKCQ